MKKVSILLISVFALMASTVSFASAADYGNTTTEVLGTTTTIVEHPAREVNAGVAEDMWILASVSLVTAVFATVSYKLSYRWYKLG